MTDISTKVEHPQLNAITGPGSPTAPYFACGCPWTHNTQTGGIHRDGRLISLLCCMQCGGYRSLGPATDHPGLETELAVAESHAPRPVIKWVGGKGRLLPELVARMPARYGRYFEPFAGGAALFFHVRPPRATLSDLNPHLIDMYKVVARDATALARELAVHQRRHSLAHYYRVRAAWNARPSLHVAGDDVRRAAMFIYLNRTCFNGLWRVNRAGEFNVPMGNYASPAICRPEELAAGGEALARAVLLHVSYTTATLAAERRDFVYFDPPYDPISASSSFTGYAAFGFGKDDQEMLAHSARDLRDRGVHVMLSNNDTPFIRKLYKGFRIDRVTCGRSISSDIKKRGAVHEVIITARRA